MHTQNKLLSNFYRPFYVLYRIHFEHFGSQRLENVPKRFKYRVSERMKSGFKWFWLTYSFRSPTNPYISSSSYPFGRFKLPIPKFSVLKIRKCTNKGQYRDSEGLKSWFQSLLVKYSFRSPKNQCIPRTNRVY